jgi:hypothetical protein
MKLSIFPDAFDTLHGQSVDEHPNAMFDTIHPLAYVSA